MTPDDTILSIVTFDCEQEPGPLVPGTKSTRARMGWQPPDWLLDAIRKAEAEGWTPPPPTPPTDAAPPS